MHKTFSKPRQPHNTLLLKRWGTLSYLEAIVYFSIRVTVSSYTVASLRFIGKPLEHLLLMSRGPARHVCRLQRPVYTVRLYCMLIFLFTFEDWLRILSLQLRTNLSMQLCITIYYWIWLVYPPDICDISSVISSFEYVGGDVFIAYESVKRYFPIACEGLHIVKWNFTSSVFKYNDTQSKLLVKLRI